MKINITEAFRAMAGDPSYHNEEGVLQEAVENIIPPAFNRLVDYAKLGKPPPGEANLPGQPGTMTPEELQTNMKKFIADRVKKDGLPKPARDTMAQLIVRYAGRSYSRPNSDNSIDFALNPSAVSLVFDRSFAILNTNLWWRSYRKRKMPNTEFTTNTSINDEDLAKWRKIKEDVIEPFIKSFHYLSDQNTSPKSTTSGILFASFTKSTLAGVCLVSIGVTNKCPCFNFGKNHLTS